MRSFRDIKRKARRDVHQRMLVTALYIEDENAPHNARLVNVRVHTKFDALGDMKGTNFNYAEREEAMPRILFMRNEVPSPRRNAIVSISPTEAYRLDNCDPVDDISISVAAKFILEKELRSLNLPSVENSCG